MANHLNRALDELRGARTEQQLAAELGVSTDTLTRYRNGLIPRCVRVLAPYPTLLAAIVRDGHATPRAGTLRVCREAMSRSVDP